MSFSKKDTSNTMINGKIPFGLVTNISFDGKKYCVKKNECFVKNIIPEYVYVIDFPYELNGEGNVSILAAFLDKNGKELAKIYIESEKEFTTVKKTAMIKIEILVTSRKRLSLHAEGGYLIPVKAYEKREAVLAATALSYDKPGRTFEKNLKDTLEAIDKAAEAKPDIIVSSECFYGRNLNQLSTYEKTVELDSEPIRKLREKAKKYNTYIAFSMHVFNKDGNPQNLGVLIDRSGEIVGTYAKTQLTMGEIEGGVEPGREAKVFECDFGKVAFAICWDLFFPGYIEKYLHQGVDVIINPTAGYESQRTSERAKESGAYIISSASHKSCESRVTAPNGRFLTKDTGLGYVAAKVDLNKEYYVKWLSAASYSTRKNVFHYERSKEV